MSTLTEQLRPFIYPGSIALAGVSRRTGKGAFNILENMLKAGYKGKLYPVNPNAPEILGVPVFPTVSDIPEPVDLALVATPRDAVLPVVSECVQQRIPAIIVVAQGFADSDETGKFLQRELAAMARSGGVRIVGPNTMGTANGFINYSSSFVPAILRPVPIGLICQTGVFFIGFPGLVLLGKAFDLGNSCDVNHAEALEYFGDDPEVKVVVVHLEGTQQPGRFIEAARSVGSKKPVIVWKTGTTEQAARVSQSHTGSITGNAAVWETALRSCGAIQVTELDELTDLVKAFSCLPPMRGRNLGIPTFSGGFAIMALDACARHNMNLPRFSGQALSPLASQSPSWLHLRNPADIWPAIGSRRNYGEMFTLMRQSFSSMLAEPGVDALLFIGGAFSRDFTAELAQLLVGAAEEFPDKPVVGYLYGPFATECEGMVAKSGKAAVFPSSERAIRALSRLAAYHERR